MPFTLPAVNRRQFLSQSFAAGACVLSEDQLWATDQPVSSESIALVSDTHIDEDPKRMRVGHTVLANLVGARDQILSQSKRPSCVIINGDMAFSSGQAGDYRTFLSSTQPLRQAGLAIHMTLGNHDNRDRFRELVNREFESPVEGKLAAILPSKHVNWFLLDTLDVVGATPGSLGDRQVEWLDEQLADRKDKPAFVMAHHNFNYHFDVKAHAKEIVPCADNRLPAPGMSDGRKLLDVFASHKHVRAFFCGHTHQWNVLDWNGVYLVNLPASAYPFRDADAIGWVRCQIQPDRTELTLQSLDPAHKHHGTSVVIRHQHA